jgi:hypothetical protein
MPIFCHWSTIISAMRRERQEAEIGRQLEAKPAAAVGAEAIALAVLLAEAEGVEHLVGLLHVEAVCSVLYSGPGKYGVRSPGAAEPVWPEAEHERLVDLRAVDAVRQRDAEVARCQPLRDLGVLARSSVAEEPDVGALIGGVEVDAVVALLLVLDQHRQLA